MDGSWAKFAPLLTVHKQIILERQGGQFWKARKSVGSYSRRTQVSRKGCARLVFGKLLVGSVCSANSTNKASKRVRPNLNVTSTGSYVHAEPWKQRHRAHVRHKPR